MSTDERLVVDELALLGAEFDDTELDRRVTEFRSSLRRLRDDPVEAVRINELVMDAEHAQLDGVKDTGVDPGEPIIGEAWILDRLIEREKAARRDRYRVLGAVIGFAVLSLAMLAVSPRFGIALVVAAIVMAGLVAAVAVRIHSPRDFGSAGGDPLLDFARSIVHSSAADRGVIRYIRSGSPAQGSGAWPSAQRLHSGETASSAARYGSRSGSDRREGPGGRREVPFGPEISWPHGFRQLDPESREVLESAYGPDPVYQQPAMDDYGYGRPSDRGGMLRRRSGGKVPLTPADVRNKQFSATRLRRGYDEEGVDAFLDEVESELDRLIQENEELRAELAECLRGGKSAVPALSSPVSGSRPAMAAAVGMEAERRQPESAPRSGGPSSDTATRVTSPAQQAGEQATADVRPSRSADPQASERSDYPEQWYDNSRLDDRVPDGSRPADPRLEGMTYSEHGSDGPEITTTWPAQPAAGDVDPFDDFWREDTDEEYTALFVNRGAKFERADAKQAAARHAATAKRGTGRHRSRRSDLRYDDPDPLSSGKPGHDEPFDNESGYQESRHNAPAYPQHSGGPQGPSGPQRRVEPQAHGQPRQQPGYSERRQPEPAPRGGGPRSDTAARVTSPAQQAGKQAIADARREIDEALARARREAGEIISDARARAESLERDAQEQHRQAIGSLAQTREELEPGIVGQRDPEDKTKDETEDVPDSRDDVMPRPNCEGTGQVPREIPADNGD